MDMTVVENGSTGRPWKIRRFQVTAVLVTMPSLLLLCSSSRQVLAFGSIHTLLSTHTNKNTRASCSNQFFGGCCAMTTANYAAPSSSSSSSSLVEGEPRKNQQQQQPEEQEGEMIIPANNKALEASYDETTGRRNNSDYRFASPLLEFGYPPAVEEFLQEDSSRLKQKPLLLYLPGFDGTYLSAFFQYPELQSNFEVRCLVSSMEDRSTYDDLKQAILTFLLEETTVQVPLLDNNSMMIPMIPGTRESSAANTGVVPHATTDNNTTIIMVEGSTAQTEQSFPYNVFANLLWKRKDDNNNSEASTNSKSKQSPTSSEKKKKKRPVYLVGESFGGILALDVALSLLEEGNNDTSTDTDHSINLQGLVVINAATCFDRSRLAVEGPPVANLPSVLYGFGILKLLPMFLDKISFQQFLLIIQGTALPSLIDNPMREAYMGRFAFALPSLLKFMPQQTFQWRLQQWLSVGCKRIEKKLGSISSSRLSSNQESLRMLIVAAENDLTLPSIAEAERLAQIFSQNSHVHVVKEVGHANTCGTCLDLAAEMRNHFPELLCNDNNGKATTQDEEKPQSLGRTQMKPVAAKGNGIYFGMEPRYDGKQIGLSPFSYWSRDNYQSVEGYSPRQVK
jgi:pimeloyl-ACP methyl ester carboxylesterase